MLGLGSQGTQFPMGTPSCKICSTCECDWGLPARAATLSSARAGSPTRRLGDFLRV
uniref:Uncharacterized protein n=1 Tax=Anguilla anguilla TaxID=7936 RepID=A0A0E9QWK1_ANGAN